MSWMPRGRSIYPCHARPNVIRPMRVHPPYIVKSVEMIPLCLIFPLHSSIKLKFLIERHK